MHPRESDSLRFGAFELDPKAGQLTRSGRRVHLTPQSIRVLTLLAERAGETVTRDEIRATLWGDDTFVDFDAAMNACVSQIRTALGDKPTAPRFVETLPRRGYRFVAPVGRSESIRSESMSIAGPAAAEPTGRSTRGTATWIAASLAVVVAALVSLVLRASPPTAPSPSAFARTRSLEAIQKFERGSSGLADASPPELLDRVKHFETAIAKEPDFAEAYAGLAEAKLIIATYRAEPPQIAYSAAKAAAAKAISLDPNLGQAHASYAAATLLFDWDWETARAHFARAVSLAPSSPRVHHWYARYLSARGRHADALRQARRGQALVPASPAANTSVGVAAFYGANLREARYWCGKAAALMPEFVPAHQCLAAISAESDGGPAATPDPFLSTAVRLAKAGDREGALDSLQRAANRHSDALVFAAVQPAFATLRSDPRYLSVLERVGLHRASKLAD
jgi:DNA-binding winged helix-turn-helix (wHTH) protein/tetratricopeptide (TPR) repeat protein